MKRIFENKSVNYETPGKYRLTVNGEGVNYESPKGNLDIKFADVGSIFLQGYCNSNRSYTVTFLDAKQQNLGEIQTDVRDVGYQFDNIQETKSILIAFAESKLTEAFPDNIDRLDLKLAFSLKEKEIRLKDGVLLGAKHQVKLSDIRRVKCIGNGTLNYLLVYTKEKGGFFDTPDMKIPVNELSLPILEAVIVKNTGKVMDSSQGNGFDQKNSNYILERYMNSTFFLNADGNAGNDWHKVAYEHIASLRSDLILSE